MGNTLGAGQQRVVELDRVQLKVALDIFKPFQRVAGSRLKLENFGTALILVFLESILNGVFAVQVVGKRNRAFHGKFGA